MEVLSVRGVWRRMCVRGMEAYVCEGCGGVCVRGVVV